MVQVSMVMVLAMVCLIAAGLVRGFAEALVLVEALALAEVSVGAGAEAAAEVDLVIGGRFKLAINSQGVNCRKD
jgi:hypothetical protein